LRSASTSELPVKNISPDGKLILSDPESLGVQIEMVRRSGASTHKLVDNLVQMVLKLSENVQLLRKDNEFLKYNLNKLAASAPAPAVPAMQPSIQGPSTLVYNDPEHKAADPALCSVSTNADAGSKSYKDILSAGLKPKVYGVDSEGFTTVSYKKKPTSEIPSVNTVRQRRQPLIGVRNSASLPIVSKRERSKALVVSRFSPEVTAAVIEKSLKSN
jgi:hypothetical protein